MDLVGRAAKSTVYGLFAARARVHPARPAIDDGARVLSYGDLARRTTRLASALASCGVGRGARAANRP
jgi:acyl-CoA synthetase (AMP-forming)/AMP-acid ligase II